MHLFAVRGRQKIDFEFFKIPLGTRMTSGKWKEVNGTPGKINELILEAKADLKERPDSHPRIIFPFN